MLTHIIIDAIVIAIAFGGLRGLIWTYDAPRRIGAIKTRLYLQYAGNTQSR